MSRRGLFSLLNVALLAASLAVMFLFPQYAAFALYAMVGWIAAGLTLSWSGWTARGPPTPVANAAEPPASVPLSGPGSPSASSPLPAIDFCIYCGTRFAPGERTCGACGHPLPLVAPAI